MYASLYGMKWNYYKHNYIHRMSEKNVKQFECAFGTDKTYIQDIFAFDNMGFISTEVFLIKLYHFHVMKKYYMLWMWKYSENYFGT